MTWDKTITIGKRATPDNAPSGSLRMFFRTSDGILCTVDESGVVRVYGEGFLESDINGFIDAKLYQYPMAWAQYTNSGTQSTTVSNTSFTKVNLQTNKDSYLNSLITKVNNTDIRTDFNGYVLVSYSANIQNTSTNDKAARAVVVKNGTAIDFTERRTIGKTNTDRFGSVAGEFLIACAVNDVFSLGFGNGEAVTDTISVYANGVSFKVEAKRRV